MVTATERAVELNVVMRLWIAEDPDNRRAGDLAEDAAHWDDQGIHTGDDLDRHLLQCAHFNGYKEIHGIPPRWIDYDAMSMDELESLVEEMHARRDAEVDTVEARVLGSLKENDSSPLTHSPFAVLGDKLC